MNRIIVPISILAAMLLFVSCDWDIFNLVKSINERLTDYHYIINPSGKKIVHELPFGVPLEHRDSTLRYCSDGSNTQEELEWIVSYVVGLTKEHTQAAIGYTAPFCLYNVSDTTSLHWYNYWTGIEYDSTKVFCPFYWKHGGETSDEKERNWITNYYLIVNDSLLSLMQKDYTMLEKFKEYYASK
jgi:hypothetical protein